MDEDQGVISRVPEFRVLPECQDFRKWGIGREKIRMIVLDSNRFSCYDSKEGEKCL